ncbi:DUF6124 family protein [Pseudomonas edaphica]|uniref:DUF6124 family protein n=1 Tax=Pseudomonas edaphica TaxID=2006980 RepID=UPI003D13F492
MKKVTPNPISSTLDETSQTTKNLIFTVRPGLSTEVALSNASEMLESATVCAYDCAEHLDGSSRKQVLAVVQMVEIAQLLVDQALNRECPVA